MLSKFWVCIYSSQQNKQKVPALKESPFYQKARNKYKIILNK